MLQVRFLNDKQKEEEPNEFSSWDKFFAYLRDRWNYNEGAFNYGVTRINKTTYRYITYAFTMIITTSGREVRP